MIFTRLNKASRPSSALAMALVLAAGGTLGATALESAAFAQKNGKKEEERKPQYSKEFIAAYQPIETIQKSEAPDYAAARPLVPALVSATNSADEKRATGGLLLNMGNAMDDQDLQLQGINLMLDSGLTDQKLTGQLSYAAYQIYEGQDDVPNARQALERAIDAGYSTEATMSDGSTRTIGADDLRRVVAQLYFEREQYGEGLTYLSSQIEERKASGGTVPEAWIKSALATAYENNLSEETPKYVALLAENYPSEAVWGDAVIITMNANQYQNPEVMDLLRLARRTKAYNDPRVLSEYVEVLDARRYPGEVVAVIDEGFASGVADRSDPYLVETRAEAAGRLESDKAGLSGLASDARAANANLKTLVVAGDTFLSYDRPAEAEEFYTKALGMSGVETPLVLTRLGIAQYDQGKYDEAIETFGKVEGARRDLANLWAIYAAQQNQSAM